MHSIIIKRYLYGTQACTVDLPQKHKAKYCSERATGKRAAAKAAIHAQWHGKENQDFPEQPTISGCRIMNMEELSKGVEVLTSHSAKCGGVCTLEGETMHAGLAVVLAASCSKCQQQFGIKSSTQVTTPTGSKKWSSFCS